MREDPAVIIMGEDIGWGGNFGQFKGLLDEFGPERIIDMPISEALILGAAVGAAVTGTRPVASMSFVEGLRVHSTRGVLNRSSRTFPG